MPPCYSGEIDISIDALIREQRSLASSKNPFERVVGSLLVAARLKQSLAAPTDAEVGQLMFERVWNVMDVFSPETTICQVATERLLNSSSVVKTTKENVSQ